MDGSERIEFEAGSTEHVALNSQPQVIVERVVPEDLIEEEIITEEAPVRQNGEGAAVTVDDIIADAVSAEEHNDSTMDTAETGEEAAATVAVDGTAAAPAEGGEEDAGDKAEGVKDGDDSMNAGAEEEKSEEAPKPERKKREPLLDQNQCRVCTSATDLQDIFEPLKRDSSLVVSTLISKICPNVHITKRDHLPHVICQSCVYKLEIAWEFKESCEKTDRELRKNLTRSQNKIRKRTDYQLLDYATSDDDEQQNDDDEFKLSDELEEDEPSDSDISFSDVEKKPRKRGRPKKNTPAKKPVVATPPTTGSSSRGRGRPPKAAAAGSPAKPRAPIVYVEAKDEESTEESSEEEEEEEEKPRPRPPPVKTLKKICAKCKEPITRGIHKCKIKTEFACTFCAEKFGSHSLYMNHQQLHTNFQNASTCIRCHKRFPSKFELRKHQSGVRCTKALKNNCMTCGRVMANASQLAIHLRSNCGPSGNKVKSGSAAVAVKKEAAASPKKDLFKFVAPPTSTYWSDSFSD